MSFQRFNAREPKRCNTCGRTHSDAQWARLPLVGHQVIPPYPPENDPGEVLELRNCGCGSTGAILMPFTGADVEREEAKEIARGENRVRARQLAIEKLREQFGA